MHARATRWERWLISTLLAMLLLAPVATTLAQDATPGASPAAAPEGLGEGFVSQTREEFTAELVAEMGYTEPEQLGGTFVTAEVGDIQGLNPLLAEESATSAILGYIYSDLVGGDPRTGRPAPTGLADYWDIADLHLPPEPECDVS
jgi:hypothetical protein